MHTNDSITEGWDGALSAGMKSKLYESVDNISTSKRKIQVRGFTPSIYMGVVAIELS